MIENSSSRTKGMWVAALLIPLAIFVVATMCVWPFPRFLGIVAFLAQWCSSLSVLLAFGTLLMAIYFAFACLWSWIRGRAGRQFSKMLACFCFVALWYVAFLGGMAVRHRGFIRASKVGDQIVQALTDYKKDKGEYPEQLEQLVPQYLGAIPYSGSIAYPAFSYRKDHNDIEQKAGEYELRIDCPIGPINFDRFIYWPSETYPDRLQGNGIERMGAWAYVHE